MFLIVSSVAETEPDFLQYLRMVRASEFVLVGRGEGYSLC